MVKKALLGGLESGVITGADLYNLDDQGLFTLTLERACPLFGLVDSVRNNRLFVVAAEIPFEEKARDMLHITERSRMEKSLSAELLPLLGNDLDGSSVIIDLPEPVSFESGLFVTDENRFFSAGSSVLKSDLLDAFAKSIRIIRVFVDPRYEAEVKIHREGILQIVGKWFQI
jgi:hypothetical protein